MDLTISRYKIYLHQFSNIVLGALVAALALSLAPISLHAHAVMTQAFLCLVFFLGILHAWWRNAELFTSSKTKTLALCWPGLARVALLVLAVMWMRNFTASAVPVVDRLTLLFVLLAGSQALSLIPQLVFMHPLYGKNRVLRRREMLTDLFFALLVVLYLVGLMIAPGAVVTVPIQALLLLSVGLVRPLAKRMTRWVELEPPHRGGRTRREQARRDRQAQRIEQRVEGSHGVEPGSGSGSRHRRSGKGRSRRRKRTGAPRQGAEAQKTPETAPVTNSADKQPQPQKDLQKDARPHSAPALQPVDAEKQHKAPVPAPPPVAKPAEQQVSESTGDNSDKKYGRRRRGRKPRDKVTDETAPVLSDLGATDEAPVAAPEKTTGQIESAQAPAEDTKAKYGRRRSKSRTIKKAASLEEETVLLDAIEGGDGTRSS